MIINKMISHLQLFLHYLLCSVKMFMAVRISPMYDPQLFSVSGFMDTVFPDFCKISGTAAAADISGFPEFTRASGSFRFPEPHFSDKQRTFLK